MNKSIEKAINLTQRLRSVMLQMVALEKEWDEYENSEEYMQSLVSDFNEGWNRSDDLAAAWGKMSDRERRDYFKKVEKLNKKSRLKRAGKKRNLKEEDDAPATDLLAQIDNLIYDLYDYSGGGDRWIDADDVDSKEVLKLKEIIARDNQFKLKEIFMAAAA